MPPKDSIANTFLVSVVLCVVCSLVVSSAAVALKDIQERNKQLDRQKNIISAAALVEDVSELSGAEVTELFDKRIEKRLVDLGTGAEVPDADEGFDPRKAAKSPDQSAPVEGFDIGIANRESQTWVYLVKAESGDQFEKFVFPVYGKGLWSTMYGYVALESDLRTIAGVTFYEHAETPGLGGEIENEVWKAKWIGKQIWEVGTERDDANLRVGVAKGSPTGDNTKYQVDGLSGATITSRGVDVLLKYWFSDEAFGPYLSKLADEGVTDGK